MSEAKKDDGHGEKKDGPGKKIWNFVGIMISVLVGLVVAFAIANALVPEVLSGFFGTVANLGNGIKQIGPTANNLNMDISVAMGGLFGLLIKIMFLILGFALGGYILKLILDKLKHP